jgi:hypothetical protein
MVMEMIERQWSGSWHQQSFGVGGDLTCGCGNGVLTICYVPDNLGPFTKYVMFDEVKPPTYSTVSRYEWAMRRCGSVREPTTTTTAFQESSSPGAITVQTPGA